MTTVDLIGCDGSIWHLLDQSSPVWLGGGIGGLHLPKVNHQWTITPGQGGWRYRGSQTQARAFTMQLVVGDQAAPYRTGADWVDLDGAFWEALAVDATATLVVNNSRKLTFRLDEDNDFTFAQDPALHGKAVYPISCIADSGMWQGDQIVTPFPWVPDTSSNYYGGVTGLGPPFVISPANLFQTALVANPGDEPAWPIYQLNGPIGIASVGVGDDVVTLPFSLNDGDIVIIDTLNETITDDQGTNLWPQMGYAPVSFAPIPPGDFVPVRIGMENASIGAGITVTLTPQYRRAWGRKTGDFVDTSGDAGGFGVEGFGTGSFGG